MNAHTKQQEDKVFEMDFIDSQNSNPPFAHLLALSHICGVFLKLNGRVTEPQLFWIESWVKTIPFKQFYVKVPYSKKSKLL